MAGFEKTQDDSVSLGIAANAAVTSSIPFKGHFGGIGVKNDGTDWSAGDLGIEVSMSGTANWQVLKDEGGNACKLTQLGTSTAFARSFGAWISYLVMWPFIRFASLNTGTGAEINQTSAQTLKVTLW